MTDVDVDGLLLEGDTLSAEMRAALTKASLTRTIDSSPTLSLTLDDPKRTILKSGLFTQKVTAQFDGYAFELASVKKTNNQLIVTMEDLAVAELRKRNDPYKAGKGTVTRVQFVRQLLQAETNWIQLFVDPSVTEVVATVELARGTFASSTSDSAVDPNYLTDGASSAASSAASATTSTLTPAQIAGVAKTAGFSGQGLIVAVAVALAESGGNPTDTNHDSNGTTDYGVWQINSVHTAILASGTWSDPLANAKMAYTISGGGQNWTPWATYNSQKGKPPAYLQFMAKAQAAAGSPDLSTASSGSSAAGAKPEDSWTCFKRIFNEVNWRLYAEKGNLYAGPDSAFINKDPILTCREFQNGVDNIDFDYDTGKPVSTLTITARAELWSPGPGSVVAVPDMGLTEKWLVSSVSRSLFSTVTTIITKSPEPELPEPVGTSSGVTPGYLGDPAASSGSPTTAAGQASNGVYGWPINSRIINVAFGVPTKGISGAVHKHQGIDIGCGDGTSVVASRAGTVTQADDSDPFGYGNAVYINHGDGQETRYGHLESFSCRRGLVVAQGQEIGKSGHTGDATGPHLHFEIRVNGTPVDPLTLLSSATRSQIIVPTSNTPIVVPNGQGGGTIFTNNVPTF